MFKFWYFSATLVLLICAGDLSAQAINGQNANLVLGQDNFSTFASGLSDKKIRIPRYIAIDPDSNKLFVADMGNNRVLRFGSLMSLNNGGAAEAVIGQVDFSSNGQNNGASNFSSPFGIAIENGTLWVSDTSNHRILRFDNAATLINGAQATAVLGQSNFNSNSAGLSVDKFNGPSGITIRNDVLWVADRGNKRVLRFNNASNKIDGAAADGVLGQIDFISSDSALEAYGFEDPIGVYIDINNCLWVSDFSNNRVLRFDNASSKVNGANADGVLGQINFNSNVNGTTQFNFNRPTGIAVNKRGTAFISDTFNNRVLVYLSAQAKTNGAAANYVLGQIDFVSGLSDRGGFPSANTLAEPTGIVFDDARNDLWITDSDNQRLLRHHIKDELFKNGFE